MAKKVILFVAALAIAAGCMAHDARRAEALTNQEVEEALRRNPKLLLDILKEHKLELFEIVQQGALAKRDQEEAARLKKEMANPKKPSLDFNRPMLGSTDAPFTVVEYSDFFCPYCARGAGSMKQLVKDNPGKYRIFFKHLPLHKNSLVAAQVFEALALQNPDLAWKFHDHVFGNSEALSEADKAAFVKIAVDLGADKARLEKDMEGEDVDGRINADMAEANAFGIRGTPGFVIEGVLVMGAYPKEKFEEITALIQEYRLAGKGK